MSLGRARISVVVGYKPDDESAVMGYLDNDTYDVEEV